MNILPPGKIYYKNVSQTVFNNFKISRRFNENENSLQIILTEIGLKKKYN